MVANESRWLTPRFFSGLAAYSRVVGLEDDGDSRGPATLWKGLPAGAALGAALGVERPALRAAVVHLSGEKLGQDGAQSQNPQKNRQVEERIAHRSASIANAKPRDKPAGSRPMAEGCRRD